MNNAEAGAIAAALGAGLAQNIAPEVRVMSADGAIPIDKDAIVLITKGSALAGTLAAPGASNVGRKLILSGGSDFAHVVAATGSTVHDGTTGGHGTLTSAAFQGSTLTLRAVTAAKWNVEANNLWVIT